ncbi:hypothetical protein J5226_08395 [Lysobacter sp. K5869]|uniref:hypothetical protein n=1 Tax=Lysobacter sp. K5869 TaxID=2820808 RepID=UPI001C061FB7|nr:hypothetical protein [Lysobacter sp. K5869]QWP78396.1 hypothetical protein J5226_08395 [Lysobacter sp. K5869]
MRKRVLFAAVLCSLLAAPAAWAQEEAKAAGDEAKAESKGEAEGAAPAPAKPGAALPKLRIVWDCGECEHNDKVPPLIEAAYAAEAQKHSAQVSGEDAAEVAIVDMRQRPPGVRVMFGIMAGRDRLKLRIRYRGHEYEANETSSNIIQGLNSLSASVGRQAYQQLAGAGSP